MEQQDFSQQPQTKQAKQPPIQPFNQKSPNYEPTISPELTNDREDLHNPTGEKLEPVPVPQKKINRRKALKRIAGTLVALGAAGAGVKLLTNLDVLKQSAINKQSRPKAPEIIQSSGIQDGTIVAANILPFTPTDSSATTSDAERFQNLAGKAELITLSDIKLNTAIPNTEGDFSSYDVDTDAKTATSFGVKVPEGYTLMLSLRKFEAKANARKGSPEIDVYELTNMYTVDSSGNNKINISGWQNDQSNNDRVDLLSRDIAANPSQPLVSRNYIAMNAHNLLVITRQAQPTDIARARQIAPPVISK